MSDKGMTGLDPGGPAAAHQQSRTLLKHPESIFLSTCTLGCGKHHCFLVNSDSSQGKWSSNRLRSEQHVPSPLAGFGGLVRATL